MSFLKENKFYIAMIYINLLYILNVVKVIYKIEDFNYGFISALILTGILLCWLMSLIKRIAVRVLIILAAALGAAVYYLNHIDYINSLFISYIIDNFDIINALVAKANPTSFYNYKPILILVLPLLSYVIMIVASKGFPNSILLVVLAMLVTIWYLGYTEEIKVYLFSYIFITLTTYCINSFVKKTKKLSKAGFKIGIKGTSLIVYTVMMSFVISGISNFLPQSFQGRYGSELQGKFYNKFGNTVENGEQKGRKYRYDLGYSGYSSTKLGGPVALNRLVALRVESDKNYYLRGSVKDFYDGFSWQQSEKKYMQRIKPEDSMLTDTFVNNFTDGIKTLVIHPEELNSSTIFNPLLAYNAYVDKEYAYFDEASTFMSSGILENPYSVFFYNLSTRGTRLLNQSTSNTQTIREASIADYKESYSKYLQVPDNISRRVYDLVANLTKDKRNNFQKVQAIREYLNKKYPYTLKVSQLPEGQEFLDYFLFTEQKGYCTYFATAETIMCRIAGIPARYVEGFNMTEEKDENGLYVVRNENAHAWTEVLYMENQSSGFWYTVDAVPNAVESIRNEEKQAELEKQNQPVQEQTPNLNLPQKQKQQNQEETLDAGALGFILSPAVRKVLYLLSFVVVLNAVILLMFTRKKAWMLRSKSVIPIYKYSLDRLSIIGYKQSEFVPDMEAIENMHSSISGRVKQVAELAYMEYYGGKIPEDFDKQSYYSFIEKYVRKNQSLSDYIIKKYYFSKKIYLIFRKFMVLYKRIRNHK